MTEQTFNKKVVLTTAQFEARKTAGTLEQGVEYEITDYQPVEDVQVVGTSVTDGGVANIPYANASTAGVIKSGYGVTITSGVTQCSSLTTSTYTSANAANFISKGTLENLKQSITFTDAAGTETTLKVIVSPI